MQAPQTPAPPMWRPLHEVARELGPSADLVRTACEAGQLPIRVARFGRKGLVFCCTADVARYRASLLEGPACLA